MEQHSITRERTTPADPRSALMRGAGDLIGSEKLAAELGVASRTVYNWMSGKRPVSDGVLLDTRKLLIRQRQSIGDLVQAIREEEAEARS